MPPKKRTATTTTTTTLMTDAQFKALIAQGVVDALEETEANRISRNGDDSHDSGTGSKRIERPAPTAQSHVKSSMLLVLCKKMLLRSGTPTLRLLLMKLHMLTWKTLKKIMTDKYYPRGEIKKLEIEIWNPNVIGNLRTLQGTIKTNSSLSKGLMWNGLSLLGPVRRSLTDDLNLCARNATTTMIGSVLPSAPIARGLAIQPGTVKASMPLLTTTREPKGRIQEFSLTLSTSLLNKRYALILFDTGSDRSFVSTAFSSLIDIIPTTLDHGCDIKIVRIPFGNEILNVRDDGSNNEHMSRLNIISYTKTQKYLLKGCHVFLAYVIEKKAKDKSKEKRLKDVPIVQDFPKVFPKDLPGIPPTRQVEFQIDLVPSATPVARAPYRLAPSEMKELSDQL
nr:putative reverse transcriptase domain-containing protein [Tanacetum cinerariifolium]